MSGTHFRDTDVEKGMGERLLSSVSGHSNIDINLLLTVRSRH
ncbi:MAG: hypothetical protein ACE1ZM_03990 [Gammaproteobacteria bacterium]